MSGRATLRDVADQAGVSSATASLVLNQRPGMRIAATTRQRVRTAAVALGYHPNRIAQSLASGTTATIGVLIPELASSFDAGIIDGIEAVCAQAGYRILLAHSRQDREREAEQIHLLVERRVDGVLCLVCESVLAFTPSWLSPLLKARFPCVLIDESQSGLAVDAVVSDDRPGALAAVRHLIARGHRRIAHLAGGQRTSSARERLAGYQQALAEAGLPYDERLVAGHSYDAQAGQDGMAQLLRHHPRAVFAASDTLAAEAMRVIIERGLRVPHDIAMVGFCNDAFARYLDLTTVHQQPAELGRRAAQRLLARIAQPALPHRTVSVATHVVVRGSCGTAR